jgi:hypothetical protein
MQPESRHCLAYISTVKIEAKQETSVKQLESRIWLILRPGIWRWHVPPKFRLTFNGLHGVISQKTFFITTAVRTWNPTSNIVHPLAVFLPVANTAILVLFWCTDQHDSSRLSEVRQPLCHILYGTNIIRIVRPTHCDMTHESQNSGTRARQWFGKHFRGNEYARSNRITFF